MGKRDKIVHISRGLSLVVTDHAVVRYFEHVYDMQADLIRKAIVDADQNVLRAIAQLGTGTFPVNDTHRVVIQEGTVVTVLPQIRDS